LVVIGFIIGGILYGVDLERAAAVRAEVTQLEQFNSAVNTFYNKFGWLPGDIPNPYAPNFGFLLRGNAEGEGDGNGVLEGVQNGAAAPGVIEGDGENMMFWQDLSQANLISEGPFSSATASACQAPQELSPYFPSAKSGQSNFVMTFSSGGINYFEVQAANRIGACVAREDYDNGLTPQQAYSIDEKIDDGNPLTGRVTAHIVDTYWYQVPQSTTGSSTTCLDQGGDSSNPWQYSVDQNSGNLNCALSIQMQGAAR